MIWLSDTIFSNTNDLGKHLHNLILGEHWIQLALAVTGRASMNLMSSVLGQGVEYPMKTSQGKLLTHAEPSEKVNFQVWSPAAIYLVMRLGVIILKRLSRKVVLLFALFLK